MTVDADTKPLLAALRGEVRRPPPLWLMRQAGRYLPEYRALRARAGSFLDLCYDPALAAEASLQPVKRFDLDGVILFSDILVVAEALGVKLWFEEGEGPRLEPVREGDVLPVFDEERQRRHLAPVYEAMERGLRRSACRGHGPGLRGGAVDPRDVHGGRRQEPGLRGREGLGLPRA